MSDPRISSEPRTQRSGVSVRPAPPLTPLRCVRGSEEMRCVRGSESVRGGTYWKGNGMNDPLACFLTFTCYGTWLHGDERGSVDQEHNAPETPVLPPDAMRRAREIDDLAQPPYLLDRERRQITLHALCEITQRKGWTLHAAQVRSNHVHLIVTAEGTPERILNGFKTAVSRRLNKAFPTERNRTRWTRHGSTRYLWTEEAVAEKVHYVLEGQGDPMECYPSRARSAAE